jgi:hypothetical protein
MVKTRYSKRQLLYFFPLNIAHFSNNQTKKKQKQRISHVIWDKKRANLGILGISLAF